MRDVRQGPDRYLYLLTDEGNGRILRLEPAGREAGMPAAGSGLRAILAVYGERDLLVPGSRSQGVLDSLAASAQGPREAVRVRGAGHQLRPGPNSTWSAEYWGRSKAG